MSSPRRYDGIVWGGDTYLLGVQCLAVVVITVWSMASTFVLLFTIDLVRIVTIPRPHYVLLSYCILSIKLP